MICFRHEEKVCREESECSYEGICDGTSARCLQSSHKPDSIPCENDSKASTFWILRNTILYFHYLKVTYYPLNPTCQEWSYFRRFISIQCYALLDFLWLKQILFHARGLRYRLLFQYRYDTYTSQVWKVDTDTTPILYLFEILIPILTLLIFKIQYWCWCSLKNVWY